MSSPTFGRGTNLYCLVNRGPCVWTTGPRLSPERGDWKCEIWICGTSLHGWKLRDMKMRDQFAGVENAKEVSMESQSVKVSQNSCICVQSYPFSIRLFDKWMWNGTILDNRTRLLMKLLMTSSADIIQECRVMFGVKSVSKSIFKRRRNVLPVVVFMIANIWGIKLNNEYIISATQLTAQLTAQLV